MNLLVRIGRAIAALGGDCGTQINTTGYSVDTLCFYHEYSRTDAPVMPVGVWAGRSGMARHHLLPSGTGCRP